MRSASSGTRTTSMAEAVYILCALTSALCALLLLRAWRALAPAAAAVERAVLRGARGEQPGAPAGPGRLPRGGLLRAAQRHRAGAAWPSSSTASSGTGSDGPRSAQGVPHGATVMASVACALFFLRFWRQSRDRLFACFGFAFVALAANWLALTLFQQVGRDCATTSTCCGSPPSCSSSTRSGTRTGRPAAPSPVSTPGAGDGR